MKIKVLVAGLAIGTSSGVAGIPLGRGDLIPSLVTTANYDSNVTGARGGPEDYYGAVTPRLAYDRRAGQFEAQANVGVTINRYVDQTQYDSENFNADATIHTTESEFRNYNASLSGSYGENSTANADLNTRVNSKTATFLGRGSLVTGPRSSLGVTSSYTDTRPSLGSDQEDFTTNGTYDYRDFLYGNTLHLSGSYEKFNSSGANVLGASLDQESYLGSIGLIHSFVHDTVHAGASYGYRILNRSAAETTQRQSRQGGSVFSVNVDGPFLPAKYFPKVSSHLSLAYQDAATPGINDVSSKELTGALGLKWQARDQTSVGLEASRSQRLSVDDLSVVTSTVNITVSQTLRHNLTGTLGAGYNWSKYRSTIRRDESLILSAGLAYHFARKWDAALNYSFNDTSSNNARSDFNHHIVNLSLTYTF